MLHVLALGLLLGFLYASKFPVQYNLATLPRSNHGSYHWVFVRYTIPLPYQVDMSTYEAISRRTNTEVFVAHIQRESILARNHLPGLAKWCQDLIDDLGWSCSGSGCEKTALKEKIEDLMQRFDTATIPIVTATTCYQHLKPNYDRYKINAEIAFGSRPLTNVQRELIKHEPWIISAFSFWKRFGKPYYDKEENLRRAQAATQGWDRGLRRMELYMGLLQETRDILDQFLHSIILQRPTQDAYGRLTHEKLLEWFRGHILSSNIPKLWNELSASIDKGGGSLSLELPNERCNRKVALGDEGVWG